MIELIQAVKTLPLPKGPRVGVLGLGGGQGVLTTDLLSSLGLKMPELEKETQNKIIAITSESGTIVKNPVDPGASAMKPQNIKDLIFFVVYDFIEFEYLYNLKN